MPYDLHLRVWRGDSSGGGFCEYTVEAEEGEVVLDALHRVQAEQANDLAIRWNCKAGKCGSCSAEVNGRPRLTCMTRLSTFEPSETITVTPLSTFPVIRDLVTDVSFNYEMAKKVPAFQPRARDADGQHRIAQVDVERSQEFRKCIECWLCQNTCHVIRDHEENKPSFAGPRFFIRYAELDMHPLDTNDRKQLVQDQMGLGMCNITKCCTEVCPENIKITDNGIIPMKERVVDRKYDPVVWLGDKIARRGAAPAAAADTGKVDGAERAARTRLDSKPNDKRALETLTDLLVASGRYGDAAEFSHRLVEAAGRSRNGRMGARNNHAWVLYCAVEAGQASLDDVAAEADEALAEAQLLAGTGTVLAGTHALAYVCQGRYEDAENEVRDSLSWARSDRERADDLLTLARIAHATGRRDEADAALAEGARLWPGNPRLATVRARVEKPITVSEPVGSGAAAGNGQDEAAKRPGEPTAAPNEVVR